MSHTIETLMVRDPELPAARIDLLKFAIELGATDEVLEALTDAIRASAGTTVIIPAHRYESLSRGRGWCGTRGERRKGSYDSFAPPVDGGYRVGPGRWVVGATDGYRRKAEDTWDVKHVTVGDQTWTVAS